MATFTWTPDQGLGGKAKPRLKSVKYGDGYEQSVPDGINYIERTHSLSFSLLSLATYQDILDFFETHGGHLAFDWTPPNGVAGRYVCEEWDDQSEGVTYKVTATFKQVYGK